MRVLLDVEDVEVPCQKVTLYAVQLLLSGLGLHGIAADKVLHPEPVDESVGRFLVVLVAGDKACDALPERGKSPVPHLRLSVLVIHVPIEPLSDGLP